MTKLSIKTKMESNNNNQQPESTPPKKSHSAKSSSQQDANPLRLRTNEAAEMGCVAAAIHKRAYFDVIATYIQPADIFTPVYRHIYEYCADCYTQTTAADAIAHVISTCGSNIEQRVALTDIISGFITGDNVEHFAMMVKEAAIKRQIFQLAQDIPLAFDENDDAFDMLKYLERKLEAIRPNNGTKLENLQNEIAEHYRRSIETAEQKRGRLVPSGILTLDELLDGGFEGGDLVVIGARPSVGKTAIGITMFLHGIRNGYGVGFISLEMPKFQIIRRLVSQISEIPMTALKGSTLNESEQERLMTAHMELSELDAAKNVFIFDGTATLTQAKHAIQHFAQENCKIIFIDYLQLIRPDAGAKNRNREQEVAEVSRAMKGIAKEFNVIIVALAQLNKEADNKTPQMAAMRESEAIIQDADYVMLLDRPEQRGMATSEYLGVEVPCIGKGFIYVRKARNGRTGSIMLNYTGEIGKFSDEITEYNNWQ